VPIYGLERVSTWTIDGQTIEIAPGEALCVSRGQIHGFENRGGVDAKFLAIATPARLRIGLLTRDRPGPCRFARRTARYGRDRRGELMLRLASLCGCRSPP
jgi:hypothetical protein